MDFAIKKEEYSCCRIIRLFEENVMILRQEKQYSLQFASGLERKLEKFTEVSSDLSYKLESLQRIAETVCYPLNDKIRDFANQISNSWTYANQQICKKYSKIRVASRTSPGVPLSLLLNNIKKKTIVMKLALQSNKIVYCDDHASKDCTLFVEIADLLHSLEKCDEKMQRCLAMLKITLHLLQLVSAVDKFVLEIEVSSGRSCCSDLGSFRFLSQLLTGELLDDNPINPHRVLAENVPKKPVFIFKNNKRKIEKTFDESPIPSHTSLMNNGV